MVRQILARSTAAQPAGYCSVALAVGHPCLGLRSYPIEVRDRASLMSPGFGHAYHLMARWPSGRTVSNRLHAVRRGALRLFSLLRRPL